MPLLARLSRIVPLIIVLALVAGVVYVVAMFLYSPTKAKEILIKLFAFLMSVLSAFFALASLYALFEGNIDVLELTASFLATTLVALGGCSENGAVGKTVNPSGSQSQTLLCRRSFIKHNPNYRKKPEKASGFKWWKFRK